MTTVAADSQLEANKQLVREHFEELVNRNNVDAADWQLAPDFADHSAPPGTPRGPQAAKLAMARLYAAVPDVHVTLDRIVAEGDQVAVWPTWRGTHEGPLFGIPPSGQPITIKGVVLWRIRKNQITDRWATLDLSGLKERRPLTLRGVLETALYTSDLEAARAFYSEKLGLERIFEVPGRQLVFRCDGNILLIFNPDHTRNEQVHINGRAIPRHGCKGPGHMAFTIPKEEIAVWRKTLLERGIPIESEVEWPNGAHSIYFRDPAGNSLELATPDMWMMMANQLR